MTGNGNNTTERKKNDVIFLGDGGFMAIIFVCLIGITNLNHQPS